jgi:hypothetical protein
MIKSKVGRSQIHLTKEDEELIEKIKKKTEKLNLNNITRTKAYFDFFCLYPEIHWAFLGHMVSRNGGWNMTDLKGEPISGLMDQNAKQAFFSFLERGNWLIFQDAYPQFLLYEESLKRKKNLFYLLPLFNVSVFMETIWNDFWRNGNCSILTIALVINEQSYLEKRVIQNSFFKKTVFDTIEFKLQELLAFTHIIFPYDQQKETKVVGQTLQHFGSLHERILLGKRLYSLLFSREDLFKNAVNWAKTHPHTGSRKDYWPHLFNSVKEELPSVSYKRRLKDCQLREGAWRLYSPKLEFAWKNVDHVPAETGDWFKDWRIIHYFFENEENVIGEICREYCEALEKIELAAIAKKAIFH